MEKDTLTYHLTKAFAELEHRIAERVVASLSENQKFSDDSSVQERLLTAEQLSEHLQISISHLYNLQKKHKDFPLHRIGKNVRYIATEVINFLNNKSNEKK